MGTTRRRGERTSKSGSYRREDRYYKDIINRALFDGPIKTYTKEEIEKYVQESCQKEVVSELS